MDADSLIVNRRAQTWNWSLRDMLVSVQRGPRSPQLRSFGEWVERECVDDDRQSNETGADPVCDCWELPPERKVRAVVHVEGR